MSSIFIRIQQKYCRDIHIMLQSLFQTHVTFSAIIMSHKIIQVQINTNGAHSSHQPWDFCRCDAEKSGLRNRDVLSEHRIKYELYENGIISSIK